MPQCLQDIYKAPQECADFALGDLPERILALTLGSAGLCWLAMRMGSGGSRLRQHQTFLRCLVSNLAALKLRHRREKVVCMKMPWQPGCSLSNKAARSSAPLSQPESPLTQR